MNVISALILFFVFVNGVEGAVSWTIYEADETTLFDGRDIMVGTQLTIIVHSDSDEPYLTIALAITEENRDYGILSARDPYDDLYGWTGSRYAAAGEDAAVWDWMESNPVQGYNLQSGWDAIAGNWFVIDYTALQLGNCQIGFYEGFYEWDGPSETITIHQLPNCDLNDDGSVDLLDYAVFASHWLDTNCNGPEWCGKADINQDHDVNVVDLSLFIECWLVE